jgi:hypothetical protein
LPDTFERMDVRDPRILAAELRARAATTTGEACADLLFLAAEYDRMAEAPALAAQREPLKVFLPK